MAVANTKSTQITNMDAAPPVRNFVNIMGGRNRRQGGTVAVAAGDDDGSVFRFARLASNAVVNHIWLLNDAITTGTVYHCGLYNTASRGGAVVDVDLFATSVDLTTARVAPLDIRFEASDINTINKMVWELLGLTSDPGIDYDLALTGATVGSGAGDISLLVEYCID